MKINHKTQFLKQSGIRSMSAKCNAMNGINLGQGICDIPVPAVIKEQAYFAIENNKSIYSACEGILDLRTLIANKIKEFNHIDVSPENQVIVTHGATGAFLCAVNTLFNEGDEVILFEPFYGYHKHILEINGIVIKTVPIDMTSFDIDFDTLKKTITPKTRGLVICSPCNPCGKVFTKKELIESLKNYPDP